MLRMQMLGDTVGFINSLSNEQKEYIMNYRGKENVGNKLEALLYQFKNNAIRLSNAIQTNDTRDWNVANELEELIEHLRKEDARIRAEIEEYIIEQKIKSYNDGLADRGHYEAILNMM